MKYSHDDKERAKIVNATAEFYGVDVTRVLLDTWIRLTADIPPGALQAAIDRHMNDPERGRYMPRPADVRANLPQHLASMHLPADAAWSIAIRSFDEADTVVWTDEIAVARDAAREVWACGDKIGARMTFRAVYERLITATHAQPRWQVSVGHDAQLRRDAIEEAALQGYLTAEDVRRHLPAPTTPEGDGAVIAGLLTGKIAPMPPSAEARERLAALRRVITSARTPDERKADAMCERRKQIEAKKSVVEIEMERVGVEASLQGGCHSPE